MLEWQILTAVLFVTGIVAYPGWNLVLRYCDVSFKFRRPQMKSVVKRESDKTELEKIFGM